MTTHGDLAQAHADLGLVLKVLAHVLTQLQDAAGGQPRGQSYDSPSVGGVPMGDPTLTAGVTASLGKDRALADLAEIEQIQHRLKRDTNRLVRICQAAQLRAANALERQRTALAADPGCASCARTEVARGQRRWSPIYRGDLCRWCHEWRRTRGGLPSVEVLEAHHRGKRIHTGT